MQFVASDQRILAGRTCLFRSLFFVILALATLSPRTASAENSIRIGGTGGGLATMQILGAEFERIHPGARVTVLPSMGSSGGIKAVIAGALDIGLSSRPLTDQERGAVAQEYGRTPFVFVTAKNYRMSDFSLSELAAIYSGGTANWPDGRQIRVVLRPASEFDTLLLKSMSRDMDRAVTYALSLEGMIVGVTDQDNADAIEKVPGALGTATLAQIITEKRRFKVLFLNGVKPGLDTLADRTYPYFKTFYLVSKQHPRNRTRQFIDFVFSDRGRNILTRSGYQVADRQR